MKKVQKLILPSLLGILVIAVSGFSCNKERTSELPISDGRLKIIRSIQLPDDLEECSGVEVNFENSLWMINDSYNTNELFLVNGNGQIERTIELNGVENKDWEDLCLDDGGNLYVGDFGNNDNDRDDLAIYIVPAADLNANETLAPEVIRFSFEDQFEFPPEDNELFFDVEAFFHFNDKIYLFTKDRSEPFTGLTKMYELPDVPGVYQAKYLNSFNTVPDFYEGAITAADISPDGTRVALLSNENIWLFTAFEAPAFFEGNVERLELSEEHQYEGLVFKNDSTFYLTNEWNEWGETQLQEINLILK